MCLNELSWDWYAWRRRVPSWLVSCTCWSYIVDDLYRVINQRFKKTASICCHRSFGNLYVEIRDLCGEFATIPKFTTSASRMLKCYHVYCKTCILDNVLTDCIHCWWSLLRPWCVHRLCRVECARAVVWLRCCYESQTRLDMIVLVAVHEIEAVCNVNVQLLMKKLSHDSEPFLCKLDWSESNQFD